MGLSGKLLRRPDLMIFSVSNEFKARMEFRPETKVLSYAANGLRAGGDRQAKIMERCVI